MNTNFTYAITIIAVCAVSTAFTRFLPFLLFGNSKKVPAIIDYLGKVLPPTVIATLVVYCIRNTDFLSGSHGLPELISIAFAAILHYIKGNTLLSIGLSTVLYMVLIRLPFFC